MLLILMVEAALLTGCMLLHALVWRFRRPVNRLGGLVSTLLVPAFPVAAILAIAGPEDGRSSMLLLLLHMSIGAAYIITYPALENLSPTLKILLRLGRPAGPGALKEDIIGEFGDEEWITGPLRDLEDSGLIRAAGGRVEVTRRGRLFLGPFVLMRRGLGLEAGEG